MKTVSQLESQAIKVGFEFYSDLLHPDKIEYPNRSELTLVCIKGKHSGEVIEIHYDVRNGPILSTNVYCQFPNQQPTFFFK